MDFLFAVIPVLVVAFSWMLIPNNYEWTFREKTYRYNRPSPKNFLNTVGILLVGAATLSGIIFALATYFNTSDTEYRNGMVVKKEMKKVDCRHSYSCNCVTSTDSRGNSHTSCSTCYEHSFDQDWLVRTSLGTYKIDTLDSQGLRVPPRWAEVQTGDPVTDTFRFTNYIKAAKDSLFNTYKDLSDIPEYTSKILDYYKANKVFVVGKPTVPSGVINQWNQEVAQINKVLGPTKQANVIVVFTSTDLSVVEKIKSKWLGGKKNDIIVVINSLEFPKIDWVNVISWTDKEIFKVTLRDHIQDSGLTLIQPKGILGIVQIDTQKLFVRKHMSDFEYLINSQDLNLSLVFLTCLLSWALSNVVLFNSTFRRISRYDR